MEKIASPADAQKLKELAISRQVWVNDRAFKNAIARKSEKGFSSIDDYTSKRAVYLKDIQARRKATQGNVSERSNKKYEMIGAYKRLKPALYIIAGLFAAWYTISHRFFMPDTGEHYFTVATPTPIATATPAIAHTSVVVSAAPIANNPMDMRSVIVTIAFGLAVLFFVLYFVSRRAKARRARSAQAAPQPETDSDAE